MAITREQVRQVAALARLRLTEDEEASLTRDLDQILDAFVTLQQLDTTGVEPMVCVDDFGSILRDDAVTNPAGDDAMLRNAPAREGRYFRVPKVIE